MSSNRFLAAGATVYSTRNYVGTSDHSEINQLKIKYNIVQTPRHKYYRGVFL